MPTHNCALLLFHEEADFRCYHHTSQRSSTGVLISLIKQAFISHRNFCWVIEVVRKLHSRYISRTNSRRLHLHSMMTHWSRQSGAIVCLPCSSHTPCLKTKLFCTMLCLKTNKYRYPVCIMQRLVKQIINLYDNKTKTTTVVKTPEGQCEVKVKDNGLHESSNTTTWEQQ